MVDIEDLDEQELDVLRKFYQHLSDKAEAEEDIHQSHSIDAAEAIGKLKGKAKRAASKELPED